MADELARLFDRFDRGTITRRQLFQALGVAAAGVALPVRAFGQGRCGGARAGTPGCDVTPAKAPFDATGWQTISLDHFTMQVADYKKEVAYYATLMNWKVRSDDGSKAVLDIGDWSNVVIRGGFQAPPAPSPAAVPVAPTGDTAAGRGRAGPPRPPRLAVWDSFAWGIDNWDTKKVEAELRKRGLNPTLDKAPSGADMLVVTDPGGMTLKLTDGRRNMRKGPANAPLPAPAPFEPTNWKTVWLDHISFNCPNYKESTAFYEALLGWKPRGDEGSQNTCDIGDIGGIIIRGGGPAGRGGGPGPGARGASTGGGRGGGAPAQPQRVARMDHISFGIQPWDADAVKAELDKRGLSASVDTGGRGDIHTAKFQSYHTNTPNGYDLQISNVTRATRTA